jgi:hypothetical protein
MNNEYSYNTDVTNINNNKITSHKNIFEYNITNNKITSHKNIFEYTTGKNMFDPNKSSPPNDFKIHAYMRMKTY